jgi:hypothetical protein
MQALVTKDEMLKVPFSRMRLDPDNERIDLGPIEWLIDNIRSEGVKEALWGYKGKDVAGKECYFVVNGSRRFAALKVIYDEGKGIDISAPFKTFNPDKVNMEQRIVERLIRNEGLPYTRLEKSSSIGKLSAYGWSNQKIASQLSMSITWVTDTLLLHSAPQRLKNIISAKELSASLAIDMMKKGEVDAFLAQYSNGQYSQPDEGEITGIDTTIEMAQHKADVTAAGTAPVKNKSNKITKKDINGLNSVKEFKNFARRADQTKMTAGKEHYFAFLCKFVNNELSYEEIADFFG